MVQNIYKLCKFFSLMEEANTNIQPPQKEHKKIKITHIFIFLIVLSFAFNIFLLLKINSLNDGISGAYFHLIKPQEKVPIDSNVQDGKSILHYNGLKTMIEEEINEYNLTGNVGVFVQDVKTGAWMGINEQLGFWPASLLKVPIMMAVLKKVERGEITLKDKVTLIQEDLDSFYGDLYKQGAGAQLTIGELLEKMIVISDNTAKNALKRQLSLEELDAVFKHVGISDPYSETNNQTVSPRDFARLFKALYYSTFLSPSFSELALDLTTDTKQEDLISKGVPPEVQVAHKFGNLDTGLLHDCGIVYHQKNPYYLCVMTNGLSLEQSGELIRKISTDVYKFVESNS